MERISAVTEFVAHSTEVHAVALGPKTSILASGGEDCKLNVWRHDSTNVWALGNNKSPIERVCFDTDEQNVVSGAVNGSLKVFDLNEGRLARSLGGHKVNVSSIQYHPYGEFIVSGSTDTTMKVWDVRNKLCIQTYTGHEKDLTCVRFSPDGKWVASSAKDGQILIWDLVAGKLLQSLRIQPAYARTFEFHPSEFIMAAVTSARTVRLWDLETMSPLCSTAPDSSFVRAMAFVPGKRELCSATKDGLKVWGWETGGSSSGAGGGGVFKLRGSASALWEGVADLRIPDADPDTLAGSSFSSNFVSVYSVSLPDVIRGHNIREGLGLAEAKERGAERERERERPERERPPFSVIGSPEAIARARAASTGPTITTPPSTAAPNSITGIAGTSLSTSSTSTSTSAERVSGFASNYQAATSAATAEAKSSSPPSRQFERRGFKSVPAVRYHDEPGFGSKEDDDRDLFQTRARDRGDKAADSGDRERGLERPVEHERKEAKDMSTSMGVSFLRNQQGHQPVVLQAAAAAALHSPQRDRGISPCEAQVDRMLAASSAFSSLLSTRLSSLRMLRRLWEKGELGDVIDYLCNIHETTRHDPLQLCLLADFLSAVELRGNGLCLDSCVRLLPLLDGMLGQSQKGLGGGTGIGEGAHVCLSSLRSLISLCEAFGELIRTTRQSGALHGNAAGVDLSREERLGKCNFCHSILLRARGQLDGVRQQHRKSRRLLEAADRLEEMLLSV